MIVAAGRGERFGRPKQLLELAGKPMVAWSVDAFASMPEISELVIVTEPEFVEAMESIAKERVQHATATVVRGGPDRQSSVRHGLDALSKDVAAVLVHDGARPLVQISDVRNGMLPVRPGTASLLASPIVDTVKVAGADGKVTRTLDRSSLWAAQTPQFATARDLRRAHAEALRHGQPPATDDAALLERAGLDVVVVESAFDNFKVTQPNDLLRAEALLRERAPDTQIVIVTMEENPAFAQRALAAGEVDLLAEGLKAVDRGAGDADLHHRGSGQVWRRLD